MFWLVTGLFLLAGVGGDSRDIQRWDMGDSMLMEEVARGRVSSTCMVHYDLFL